MNIPVIVLHHALPEALLARCIPQLDLDALAIDGDGPLAEVHADGGLSALREAAGAEAVGEAGLPHVGVPDDDDLEDAGARGGQPAGERAAARQAQLQRGLQVGRRGHHRSAEAGRTRPPRGRGDGGTGTRPPSARR